MVRTEADVEDRSDLELLEAARGGDFVAFETLVERYRDQAVGLLELSGAGGGRFRDVLLQPQVRFRPPADLTLAKTLHARAHALCFIASSMNFPVRWHPDLAQANEPDQER